MVYLAQTKVAKEDFTAEIAEKSSRRVGRAVPAKIPLCPPLEKGEGKGRPPVVPFLSLRAKRGNLLRAGDCFVALLLAMTKTPPAI